MADETNGANVPAVAAPASPPDRRRVYHTLAEKVGLVIEAERLVRCEKKLSRKAFCRKKGIDPAQLRRWEKNLIQMKQAMENTSKKKSKLTCNRGRSSQLASIRDKLLPWIKAYRASGKTLSVRQVAIQVRKLDKSHRRTRRYTLFAMVRRFLVSNGIVLRCPTHKSQEDTDEKKEIASSFLASTIPRISQPNRSKAFIINMDQTPYNPKDTASRTLAEKGAKTVNVKEIKTSVSRITACLAVCADGTKLPPLLVYRAKPTGTVWKEFKDYPEGAHYIVQENAWCDERVMLYWIDTVLKPYVETAPKGVVPYLLLDKYTCHYQGSVARAIESLGVEWDILPGGCTGLIQPIDVGINKPWKNRLRYKLEDFIMETDGYERIAPKMMRPKMAHWAIESWAKTHEHTVWNSWRHKPFSYFPEEATKAVVFQDDDFDYSSDEEETVPV